MREDEYEVTLTAVPFPGEAPIKQIRKTGDGLAAAPSPDGPTWMAFDGPRSTPPKPQDKWFDVRGVPSEFHRHSAECMTPAEGGPKYVTGGTAIVPETGWFVCMGTGREVYFHQHGEGFASHLSGDRRGGCPVPDDLAWD
jgi:hypothetical protein